METQNSLAHQASLHRRLSDSISDLEYRTPAIYRATPAFLSRLDGDQCNFLHDIGVDETVALIEFHLAPLSARRDLALLGMIHRTMLDKGPAQFVELFSPRPFATW